MNEEHIPEKDLEETIDNESREEVQQKGQSREKLEHSKRKSANTKNSYTEHKKKGSK